MADFAILASHPTIPKLLIGISLDAFDHNTATDLAFHLCHSYRVPGLFFPYKPQSTAGIYLVYYRWGDYTRLAAIEASSKAEAELFLAHLAQEGRIITPDQPIA
jgi:hypothetical protein